MKLLKLCHEDVFKRLSSFIATVEDGKAKQKQWAEKFYTDLYEGRFVSGGRVLAGSGDLYRIKTLLPSCFVSKIQYDDIDSIYRLLLNVQEHTLTAAVLELISHA